MFSKKLFFPILFSFVANSYGMQSAKTHETRSSSGDDSGAGLGLSAGFAAGADVRRQAQREQEEDEAKARSAGIAAAEQKKAFNLQADCKLLDNDLMENYSLFCPKEIMRFIRRWKRQIQKKEYYTHDELLLAGPVGVGKSTLAKVIAMRCEMPFFKYSASFIAKNLQDEEGNLEILEKIFAQAAALEKPCVIIVDGIEALLDDDLGPRMYDSLVEEYNNRVWQFKLSGGESPIQSLLMKLWKLRKQYAKLPIFCIYTINDAAGVPKRKESLRDGRAIEVGFPSEFQRAKSIAYYMSLSKKIAFDKALSPEILAQHTVGFSHVQLKNMIKKAAIKAFKPNSSCVTVTLDNCLRAISQIESDRILNFSSSLEPIGGWLLRNILIGCPEDIIELINMWEKREGSYEKNLPKQLILVGCIIAR